MTERRLAAIVAADVAGYTRLMAADEEGTLAALRAHRAALIDPAVAQHRGTLVKTTGDGLLLEFASAVEATACAVAIQRGMAARNAAVPPERRLVFRIGVHVGDVIAEGGDVFGDGVNLAARLEQAAEPGGICLSEDAWRQVRGKIDAPASDGGRRRFKNVPEAVGVYCIAAASLGDTPAAPAPRRLTRPRLAAAAAALVLAASGGAGVWYVAERAAPRAEASRSDIGSGLPVVAVLPFADHTGGREQGYLADGITDELIGAIGRFNTLRVIGRNAVLPYKGRAAPRAEIVSRLGASYVVEGSVRSSDSRVRIAARLGDAATGTVIWSNSFDAAPTDILEVQERIAREIAGMLATSIDRIELRRRIEQPKPTPDAHDLVLRARALGNAATRTINRQVRQLTERAIALDPTYAKAHALLAEAILAQVMLGWTEFAEEDLARGQALARRAIALAPAEPDGYRALGIYLGMRGRYREARTALQRAIEINPSDTAALAVRGRVLSFDGELDAAIESFETALRFDPALDEVSLFDLSVCYYLARRHEDSLRIAQGGLARFPEFVMFNATAAAAAAQLGRTAEAAHYAAELQRRFPVFDLEELGSRYSNRAYGEYLRQGLALAGITSG